MPKIRKRNYYKGDSYDGRRALHRQSQKHPRHPPRKDRDGGEVKFIDRWADDQWSPLRCSRFVSIRVQMGFIGNVQHWLDDEEMSKDGITLEEIPYEETRAM